MDHPSSLCSSNVLQLCTNNPHLFKPGKNTGRELGKKDACDTEPRHEHPMTTPRLSWDAYGLIGSLLLS